jgi:hypothetical protein
MSVDHLFRMDPWEDFVQRTLLDLRSGAKIPQYFGCLIALLSREVSPVYLPALGHAGDPPDDFLSLEVIRPRQSPPQSPPKPDVSEPPSLPPSPQKPPIEEEEEAAAEPIPSGSSSHFAEQFRAIGDRVFDQLWPAGIKTDLPRVTRDSKCWVDFRVEKFKRRKERMLEQAQMQRTSDKLRFVRQSAEESQNSE